MTRPHDIEFGLDSFVPITVDESGRELSGDAVIRNTNRCCLAGNFRIQTQMTIRARESARIAQQIAYRLRQTRGIRKQRYGLRGCVDNQLLALGFAHRTHGFDGLMNDGSEIRGFAPQLQLAAADAAGVEQVVDETHHHGNLAFEHAGDALHGTSVIAGVAQDLGGVAKRRERVAQFVREHR